MYRQTLVLLALIASVSVALADIGGFVGRMGSTAEGMQNSAEAAARLRAQQLQNERMEQQLRQQQQREAEQLQGRQAAERFWAAVGAQIPNFVAITKDPGFNFWLDSRDPLTDLPRRTYWIDAINNGYVNQVVAILNEWRYVPSVPPAASKIIAASDMAFVSELTRLQPKWPQINADLGFKHWLLSYDPKTMISRQTYLDDAQKARDVSRVERIFAAYLFSLPAPPAYMLPEPPPPAPKPAAKPPKRVPM